MQECLSSKEKVLLEYISTRYKKTLEVKFRIPLSVYSDLGLNEPEQYGNLLMSLFIRKYITFDTTKDLHILWTLDITLTEKALNLFNMK